MTRAEIRVQELEAFRRNFAERKERKRHQRMISEGGIKARGKRALAEDTAIALLQITEAYSYKRGAAISQAFWKGVYVTLRLNEFSHREAVELIYSKHTRWMLDRYEGETTSGKKMAAGYLERSGDVLAEVRSWFARGDTCTDEGGNLIAG